MPVERGTISRAELEARGRQLVLALNGTWHGDRGLCCCPAHLDRTPSLSVRVGDQALLFKCFAGCETVLVLQRIAGIDKDALQLRTATAMRSDRASWDRQRVSELWNEARPIADTPAEAYLRSRGITTRSSELRFHPRTPLKIAHMLVVRPAMLAAVRERGRLLAVQRAFLDVPRASLAAAILRPRRMLGRPEQGAVNLADHGYLLGLAEGIETALSAMQMLQIPVWATLGAERLAKVDIPDSVAHLVLLPDADAAGDQACRRALRAHTREGRIIEVRLPPPPAKDWNDAQRAARPSLFHDA